MPLKSSGLLVQALDRRQLLEVPELGLLHGGLQHLDGAIVNLQWHREGMPVFAAMGQEKRAGSLKR